MRENDTFKDGSICMNVLTSMNKHPAYALLEYDVDSIGCNTIGHNLISSARNYQHRTSVHTIFSGRMHARSLTVY